jgi:hypothetical protein
VSTTGSAGGAPPPPPPPEVRDHRTPPPPPPPPPPTAHEPPAPPPVSHAPVWDSKGWTLIGSAVVNGAHDRDTIRADKAATYDELTMVVTDSDLQLNGMTIIFTNKMTFSPKVTHMFREGQRTRAIDLPGADRAIDRIELSYANIPGGGKAHVEIWGRSKQGAAPDWDTTGWTKLGVANVSGHTNAPEVQKVQIGKTAGAFTALTLFVPNSDVQLQDMVIVFGNGEKFSPKIKHSFKEGQRSRAIDLRGKARAIDHVELTLLGGTNTHVQIWGKNVK